MLRIAFAMSVLLGAAFSLSEQPVAARKQEHGKGHVLPSNQHYDTGIAKYRAKDYDAAIDEFKQAIYYSRNEYHPQAYYWLGVCYKLKHEDAKAIEAFNKHREQFIERSPDACVHLGEIFLRNNRLDEAEEAAKEALSGDRAKGFNLYGLVDVAKGDLEAASMHFLDALGPAPWTFTEAWMNYIDLLIKKKNWSSAIYQLTHILDNEKTLKNLDYEKVYLNRGLCLLAVGNHQAALEDWHRVLALNPEHLEAHLQLAMMFDMEKHISSAIKEYKEFVRLSDDPKRTGPVKERIHALELMIKPKEAEPQQIAPSPYMRQKLEEAERMRRAQQEEAERGKLEPHDAGF
ncbi:MAG TPA: tetratricopeptide repeat protein [Candidatus Obscuribacterales bacterium]